MINIELKGADTLLARLDAIKAGLSGGEKAKVFTSLANEQANLIKTGTLAGRDVTGQAFTSLKFRVGMPLADTGKMLAAVHPMSLGAVGAAVVLGDMTQAKKGYWHQVGTGIYGPTRRRITPQRARALGPITMRASYTSVKTGRIGTKTVGRQYFTSVAGIPPRPWFGFRPGDVAKLVEKVQDYLDTILKKGS